MSYPKNAASPPPLFATVVKAADGTAITSGVAAKYSTGAGSQGAGSGTCQHEGNGQWSYTPTQGETNVIGFGVQFYHADAVGNGPTISVVTSADVAQTGDVYALVTNATYGLDKLARTGADGDTLKTLSDQIDDVPTAAENASQVRTELATELARIDAAISTRLATAGYTAPPAVGAVADAVLDEAMTGHTTPGTAGAALAAAGSAGDPWITDLKDGTYDDPDTAGYIVARLADFDMTAVTQVVASNAGHLTITAGLTFYESVTGLVIPADWVSAIWTLKRDVRDTDAAALVQVRATNPAAETDGLQRLNGATPVAPIAVDDGLLTVNQAGGSIVVGLSDELSAQLAPATALGWDVKFIDAGGDSSGQRGTADVVLTETRATA